MSVLPPPSVEYLHPYHVSDFGSNIVFYWISRNEKNTQFELKYYKAKAGVAFWSFPLHLHHEFHTGCSVLVQKLQFPRHVYSNQYIENFNFQILLMHSFLNKSCQTWNTLEGTEKRTLGMVLDNELKIHTTISGITLSR